MKRNLIIPLILAMILVGCSQGTSNEKAAEKNNANAPATKAEEPAKTEAQEPAKMQAGVPANDEIFDSFVEEKDLNSYVLQVEGEQTLNSDTPREEETDFKGTVEIIKDHKDYNLLCHDTWYDEMGNIKNQFESYRFDKTIAHRSNNGPWEITSNPEAKGKETYFANNFKIGPDTILKPLKDYYTFDETNTKFYEVELKSNPNNINEIRSILFPNGEDQEYYGELTELEAEFTFNKDNYYPVEYDWEAKFINKDNEVMEISYEGKYDKINELQEIVIPAEVTGLLETK